MTDILSLKEVTVVVGEKPILRNLSLTIKAGEFHVLLGPNGSGKSTLASVLAGHPGYSVVDSPTTHLEFAGTNLLDVSADQRAQLGMFMAFQQPIEVPGVKVLNFLWEAYQVRFPNKATREHASIVQFKQALEAVVIALGIKPELLFRGVNEGFSGGEKKRLEIAQMMMLAPKLALLDEIDSGLDVDALKLVAASIAQVRQQHHTAVVMITHHQRMLEFFKPNQVHVLKHGQIVKSGGVELVALIEASGYQAITGKE